VTLSLFSYYGITGGGTSIFGASTSGTFSYPSYFLLQYGATFPS